MVFFVFHARSCMIMHARACSKRFSCHAAGSSTPRSCPAAKVGCLRVVLHWLSGVRWQAGVTHDCFERVFGKALWYTLVCAWDARSLAKCPIRLLNPIGFIAIAFTCPM